MKPAIRICMIGAGRVGKNHSRAIAQNIAAARIVAIVDTVDEVRQQTAVGIRH